MSSSSFKPGAIVEIDNRLYELLRKISCDTWQLEELRTKRISEYQEFELSNLYNESRLIFASRDRPLVSDAAIKDIGARYVELSPEDWELAKVRRAYVQAVIDLPNSNPLLRSVIQDVWNKLRTPKTPPGATSVYRQGYRTYST